MRVHDWYFLGEPYDFSAPVTDNITLKAIWVLEIPDAITLAESTVEHEKLLEWASTLSYRSTYAIFDCLVYERYDANYYIIGDSCLVEPNDVASPVCLDGISYGGKTYLCEYFRGRSDFWLEITFPETLRYFTGRRTMCMCDGLKELVMPDSVTQVWCTMNGNAKSDYTAFLSYMPHLRHLHFGWCFEGFLCKTINNTYLNSLPEWENVYSHYGAYLLPEIETIDIPPKFDFLQVTNFRTGQFNLKEYHVDPDNGFGYVSKDGMIFSSDFKRLIAVPKSNACFAEYGIPTGIVEIGDGAISENMLIDELDLTGVELVGDQTWSFPRLKKVWIPKEIVFSYDPFFMNWSTVPGFAFFTDASDGKKWGLDETVYRLHEISIVYNATKAEYDAYEGGVE